MQLACILRALETPHSAYSGKSLFREAVNARFGS
jgi:hypothetical protein